MLDPGVADQNVDAPETRGRGVHAALHLAFVRHIHAHRDRMRLGAEIRGEPLRSVEVDVGHAHGRALPGECTDDVRADPARTPGYDGGLALQLHDWKGPLSVRSGCHAAS